MLEMTSDARQKSMLHQTLLVGVARDTKNIQYGPNDVVCYDFTLFLYFVRASHDNSSAGRQINQYNVKPRVRGTYVKCVSLLSGMMLWLRMYFLMTSQAGNSTPTTIAARWAVGPTPCNTHMAGLKALLMGGSLSILNKEPYHYALSHDMAQGALVFSACTGRPFDEQIMYTDIVCEHTLTFQLNLI